MRSTHRATFYVFILTFLMCLLFHNLTPQWPFAFINVTSLTNRLLFLQCQLSFCTHLLIQSLKIELLAIFKNSIKLIFMPQMDPLIDHLPYHIHHCLFIQFIEVISKQVQMLTLNQFHKLRFAEYQFVKRNFTYFDVVYGSRISNINT